MTNLPFFDLQQLGLSSSPSQLLTIWLQQMQTAFPGYQPSTGNLEYVMAQIFASWAADLAQLASAGGDELFQTYGTSLIGVAAELGSPAIAVVSFTASPLTTPIAQLSAPLSTGGAITSLPVAALAYVVVAGSLTLTDGAGHTQTWTTTGAALNATSIPVSSQTPNFAYPSGSTISGVAQYTLPAGSQVLLSLAGAPLGFVTSTDLPIQSGGSATANVAAVLPGTAFNGAGSPASMNSQISWLSSVSVISPASAGQDPEDPAAYRDRLAATLQLLAPRPITANDYATMALNFVPQPNTDQQEVGRSTAIDGYDPTSNTYNNSREVTVCVADALGNPLTQDTMYGIGGSSSVPILLPSSWGVLGWLRSLREVNFIVNVVAPNYTAVYVATEVKGLSGFAAATIQTGIQTALMNYLNPTAFGLPQSAQTGWSNTTSVYRSQLLSIIQGVAGVDHVVSLSLGFGANPTNTTSDLLLPGPFPLPTSSTATIPLNAITVDQ